MVICRRRRLLAAILVLGGFGALALALPAGRSTSTRTVRSEGAEARAKALADLRSLVMPSAAGGWVLGERNGEPAPDRWLLAASARGTGLDQAAAAATAASTGADSELAARAAASMATAVAVAPGDLAAAPDVAAAAWQAAQRQRSAGDPAWLGLAVHLAIGPAPTSTAALDDLRTAAGRPTCADLPAGDLPAPGGALVVLLRVLAADGRPCDQARALLGRVLADPPWKAPIAIAEVTDLLSLVADPDDELHRVLAEQYERWAAPADGSVTDLALLAELRRGWTVLGQEPGWSGDVRTRLDSVVLAEGRVSDRAVQPATPLDLLALRLLDHEGLVPPELVVDTVGHLEVPADGEEAIGAGLIIDGSLPACGGQAPEPNVRLMPLASIAAGAMSVRVAACAERPVVDVAVEAASAPVGRRLFEVIGVVLAACRVAPAVLEDGVALDLADDPFAVDALGLVATVLALDPPAACAAMGWP